MRRHGSFEGFPLNSALVGLGILWPLFFGQELTHVGLFCSWIFLKFASKRPYDECSFSWQSLACSLVQFAFFSTRHRFKQKSSVQTPFNVFSHRCHHHWLDFFRIWGVLVAQTRFKLMDVGFWSDESHWEAIVTSASNDTEVIGTVRQNISSFNSKWYLGANLITFRLFFVISVWLRALK